MTTSNTGVGITIRRNREKESMMKIGEIIKETIKEGIRGREMTIGESITGETIKQEIITDGTMIEIKVIGNQRGIKMTDEVRNRSPRITISKVGVKGESRRVEVQVGRRRPKRSRRSHRRKTQRTRNNRFCQMQA